ncbi:hypothetical protein VKT23_013782 [Stygiomarasmius scandens]|uniref:Uncharacterized protein n=1 Tax=Marasmiellus scandens TaxID=2682957 RepID=A0ABR1J7M8_9AGAR
MSPVLFFHTVALTTFVSLGATIVAAQFSISYSIRTITITSTTTNFTSFDSIRNLGMTWDIAQANENSLPFTFSTTDSAIELMNGAIAGTSNSVLDVVSTNIDFTASIFSLRTSLPTGSYHFRVHSIVNTTIGSSTTFQDLTARGGDFHWTLPSQIGCGPGLQPDPFTVIPAINSPSWTSLLVTQPPAGGNFPLSHAGIFVSWAWRNRNNAGGQKISSFAIQVVKKTDGSAVGAPISIASSNLFFGSTSIDPVSQGMQLNQAYQLRIQYINGVQDGVEPPGQVVTYTSDEFNIVDSSVNCSQRNIANIH